MSDDMETTLEIKGLAKLMKALKAPSPSIKIGILGASPRKAEGDEKAPLTNAEIGALYEFNDGSNPNRPGGSFLRVPLIDNLDKYLKKSGALGKDAMAEVIKQGSLLPWAQKVAAIAENVVMDGFSTGGFGKWKPSDMSRKKNLQTLVETQQLRNSITTEVKES